MRLLIISLLLCTFEAYAGIIGNTRITGRVLRYDEKTVTISQYGKRRITVPRSSIEKKFKKLKTGILVTAVFDAQEVMDKIQKQTKK